jgi:putative membrane protein (TIGR04086 family)
MELKEKMAGILKALVTAYIITGVMLLCIAFALYKFGISENVVNILIIVVYVVASFVGGIVVGKAVKEQRFIWGIILGIVYMLIIGIMSVIINGEIDISAGSTLTAFILCVCGGMAGGMLS